MPPSRPETGPATRIALGDDAGFDRAWQEGRAMTTDEVIMCALEERGA
jgi:hypothetical protein